MFNRTIIPSVRIRLRSPSRCGFIFIGFTLVCIALVSATPPGGGNNTKPDGDLGNGNTGEGAFALSNNTTGADNTALGSQTLFLNTTGNSNTATGFDALFANTAGSNNIATGDHALIRNTTGNGNTANGTSALPNNTTGDENTANGDQTLSNNTTGNNNIALGSGAGFNLTTGDFNIDIGNTGVAAEANTIRIGDTNQTATFIAGISGVPVTGDPVVVDASGHLGTLASSARFKNEIKGMDKTSEAIFGLKPVTFRYKHEVDAKQLPQFGLVAEEVEKVDPDLVAHDAAGEIYTVRYEAVNAMLLNEFLKEHRRVEELEAAVKQLQSVVAKQQKSSRKRTMR
jgi:hypothetical protein